MLGDTWIIIIIIIIIMFTVFKSEMLFEQGVECNGVNGFSLYEEHEIILA